MIEKHVSEKLAALRAQMKQNGVDGYLVPHDDEFLGEYTPACAERMAWLTGFTGSAGSSAVLADKAFVLSDGRYTIQLKKQVDAAHFETSDSPRNTPLSKWLGDNAAPGARIGYDPRLHTPAYIERLAKTLKAKNIELVPIDGNLVDAVWDDRPAAPASTVSEYPVTLAGKTAAEKRKEVSEIVREAGGDAVVLASADSIAWLLNIRGEDVPHIPLALSYAVLHKNGAVDWFIDPARVPAPVKAALGKDVRICKPVDLGGALDALGQGGKTVMLDFDRTSIWFKDRLAKAGAKVVKQADPCTALKALKNDAEIKAITDAHIRDGVAMVRFLKWIDDEAPKGSLTELAVEDKLLSFRKMDPGFRDTSFDTIAGWAGNGAIVHYRATPESSATIKPPGILLVDSGGQYPEGTTDITRTVAVGAPSEEMKENNTRVLKGHIGIATVRFPENVTGVMIDILARKALWDAGRDYAHGTGHGVGCFLSVHEGGCGISPGGNATNVLQPGMLISNEPGYYKEGAYGIRIENLVLVTEDGPAENGGKMMRFETVTLAPIDRRLIKPEMLAPEELQWLDDYHERVYQTLAPRLDADTAAWLRQATAPLKKSVSPAPVKNMKFGP